MEEWVKQILKDERQKRGEPLEVKKIGQNYYSTLTPKNQNLPIFGHFSPVISDVPTPMLIVNNYSTLKIPNHLSKAPIRLEINGNLYQLMSA